MWRKIIAAHECSFTYYQSDADSRTAAIQGTEAPVTARALASNIPSRGGTNSRFRTCLASLSDRGFVMRNRWTPSIVPSNGDQNVYLVVDDFGDSGRVYREADVEHTDLETVITDLMSGQYNNPVRIVAFNTSREMGG